MATRSEELRVLLKVDSDENASVAKPLSEEGSSDVVKEAILNPVADKEPPSLEQSPLTRSVELDKKPLAPDKANKILVDRALTQMNFTPAAKQLLLDPEATNELDSLKSIALTQEYLVQVKISLGHIIDSLHDNPSMISRAAQYWGELPLWQRILGGVVISGPTLVVGAAAHIGFLVTISGVSALAYTTSGIILDDHHIHSASIAEKLKQGIFGIAEVLERTVVALDNIRQKLAVEVKRFQEENEKLAKNVTHLNEEIETLSAQIEVFVATEQLLRKRKDDLEEISKTLKQDLEKQKQQAEANQKEIDQIKELHKKSLDQLTLKVEELTKVRTSLSSELDKAKLTATTLEGTVKILSTAAIRDITQRQNFQERLSTFLDDKSISFDQVAERMSKTEKEISQVKLELQASNNRYKEMLAYQEQLIQRLEKLDKNVDLSIHPREESASPSKEKEIPKSGGILSFFAIPQIWPNSTGSNPQTNPDPKAPPPM